MAAEQWRAARQAAAGGGGAADWGPGLGAGARSRGGAADRGGGRGHRLQVRALPLNQGFKVSRL